MVGAHEFHSARDICLDSVEDDARSNTEDDPTDLALDRCYKHLKSGKTDDEGSNASTLHPKSVLTLNKKSFSEHKADKTSSSRGGIHANGECSPKGGRFYELSFNNSQHFMLGGGGSKSGANIANDEEKGICGTIDAGNGSSNIFKSGL